MVRRLSRFARSILKGMNQPRLKEENPYEPIQRIYATGGFGAGRRTAGGAGDGTYLYRQRAPAAGAAQGRSRRGIYPADAKEDHGSQGRAPFTADGGTGPSDAAVCGGRHRALPRGAGGSAAGSAGGRLFAGGDGASVVVALPAGGFRRAASAMPAFGRCTGADDRPAGNHPPGTVRAER